MASTEKQKQEKNRPSHSENKKQLRLALTTLMLEKNINEITVSQLTALADLNRSTFLYPLSGHLRYGGAN